MMMLMNYAVAQDAQSFTGNVQHALAGMIAIQKSSRPLAPALQGLVANLRALRANVRDLIARVDGTSELVPESIVESVAANQAVLREIYSDSKKLPWPIRIAPAWHAKKAFREMETLRWTILEHNADMEKGCPRVLNTPDEIDKFFSSL